MTEKVLLCKTCDLANGEAKRFEVNGKKIAIVRVGEEFFALSDTCSHANYSLSEGEVFCEDRTIECWKHGSAFSLVTGMALNLPATRGVPVYEVIVEGEEIYVVC